MYVYLTLPIPFQCEDANGWTNKYRAMAAYALVMVFVFPIGVCLSKRRTGDDKPVQKISLAACPHLCPFRIWTGLLSPGIPGLYVVLLYRNRKLLFPKYEFRDEDGRAHPHRDNPAGWQGSFFRQPWWGQEDDDPYASLTEHQHRKIAQYAFLTESCESIT